MTKEQALEKYIKSCQDSFNSLIVLKNDFVYYAKDKDNLRDTVFNKYRLISRIQWMTFKLAIIELYKLLKESEVHSLFNLIKKYGEVAELDEIQKSESKKLIKSLRELQSKRMYSVIKNLRNKHYAHLSRDRMGYDIKLSAKELNEFVEELIEIFKKIYSHVRPDYSISFKGLNTDIDMYLYRSLNRHDLIYEIYDKIMLEENYSVSNQEIIEIFRK